MVRQVRFGVPTDDSGLAIRFGMELGFFAEAGIDLALRTIYGGPELGAALDSGEIDMGELGTPPALTAMAAGRRFRIVASALERGPAFFLLVHPGLHDFKDLKGTVVGVLSKGSCGYWYVREILSQHGLDPDADVTYRELRSDYGRQLELFAAGEVDVMLSNEPSCAAGEAAGIVKVWGSVVDLVEAPRIQWLVEAAGDDFARRNPDRVVDTLAAIRRSSRHALSHPSEWAAFWTQHLGIDRATAERAIERERPFRHPDGDLDLPGLDAAIAIQRELGAIPSHLGAEDFIDLRFHSTMAMA